MNRFIRCAICGLLLPFVGRSSKPSVRYCGDGACEYEGTSVEEFFGSTR